MREGQEGVVAGVEPFVHDLHLVPEHSAERVVDPLVKRSAYEGLVAMAGKRGVAEELAKGRHRRRQGFSLGVVAASAGVRGEDINVAQAGGEILKYKVFRVEAHVVARETAVF